MKTFDAIVVGTGQAGPTLAARLSAAGYKVAVVEKDKFGGTCVNNGCTPTKALVASAYAAHLARRAAEYGVVLEGPPPRVDMKRVKARTDEIVRKSRDGLGKWLDGMNGITVHHGHARFVGPREIQVGDDTLTADKIFLNVGGRPAIPDFPGIADVPFLTNVTMMDLDSLPRHLVIVGGSYIGLEFGQVFRRLGSEVTVVEMGPRLVGREDEDVSAAIQDFLQEEGIALRLDAKCISLRKETGGVSVGLQCHEGAPLARGSHVLLAVGRVPNTNDLGLDVAGIRTDKRGFIEVDEALRTSNEHVWALGDCNGKGAFTHTAYDDFEIVAGNLLSNAGYKYTDRITAYALYTDPPLGRVGMSEDEIRKKGIKALVGKRPMKRVARAIEKGETKGFLKIHVDADSKRILGAALLGTGCDEAVHTLLDAMYLGMPYTQLQRHVRIHPTVSELLPTVLEKLEPLPEK